MNHRIWMRAAALVAVAGLALSGCAATADESGESTVAEDLTLRLALKSAPANLAVGQWNGNEAYLYLSVYDTLVGRTVEGDIVPAIAEAWEYSNDNTTLTLDIRDGMTFTDDTVVDATAVAASLEASRVAPTTSSSFASVSTITAADDSTLVVEFDTPDAAFIPLMTGISGAVGSLDALTDEKSSLAPIGSGAYTLDQEKTTVGSKYTLQRNPDNWNVDAYPFATVEFTVIQDETAIQNAVQAGQIDFTGLKSKDLASVFPADKFTIGVNEVPQAYGALWILDRAGAVVPALADVRVRQAINLALDRDSITEGLNPGSTQPTNQMLNPFGDAFDEKLLAKQPYDPEEARALLAEAGYADGFSVTMPSTVYSTMYESIIGQQLADIGIEVIWESVAVQDLFTKVFSGSYGMYFMFNGFSGADASDVRAVLGGIFNPSSEVPADLQVLLDTADAAPAAEQGEAFSAVNEYFVKEAWSAPIFYSAGTTFVSAKNITFTPPLVGAQNVLPWQPASTN